jgi:hypothetical protein
MEFDAKPRDQPGQVQLRMVDATYIAVVIVESSFFCCSEYRPIIVGKPSNLGDAKNARTDTREAGKRL